MGVGRRDLVILAGLFAATALLYLFALLPFSAEHQQLTRKAEQLAQEAVTREQKIKTFQTGRGGLEQVQARLEAIRNRLLPPGGVSPLLAQVSAPAKELGVRIVSFNPTDPDPARQNQIMVDLLLEGTYLHLGQYLEAVVKGPYLLAVENLRLQPQEPRSATLRMHLKLKTWTKESSR